jgi:two-component system sensor histidine kinase UhpB
MWKRLSLRSRLGLFFGMMFVAAVALGMIALQLFATEQLAEEAGPAARSAQAVADALNAAVASSPDPRGTLEAFTRTLGGSHTIQFRPADPVPFSEAPVRPRDPAGKAPKWFTDLLLIPQIGTSFPVLLEGRHAGDIVFSPDLSWDVYEKWIGFLAIVVAALVLTATTGVIAYFTVGTALRPLQDLAEGLTRMRAGDYSRPVPLDGPPEIRRSCAEANELAARLGAFTEANRDLLHKIVSLQDDERRDIARELHDELGPLLFGIRAGAVALRDSAAADAGLHAAAEGVLQSAEALQQANRRILDHLRPLYIQELGLVKSIETLLQRARAQAAGTVVNDRLDPRLDSLDGPLAQTVYRVIQESLTNALRHAATATRIDIEATLGPQAVTIAVADDGQGFGEIRFGRGLTGMHERVRALSGSFAVSREAERTVVRCRLPVVARKTANASTGNRAGS